MTRLWQTGWFEAPEVSPYSFLLPIPKGCPVSVLPFREEAERRVSRAGHSTWNLVFPVLKINKIGFKLMMLLESAVQYEDEKLCWVTELSQKSNLSSQGARTQGFYSEIRSMATLSEPVQDGLPPPKYETPSVIRTRYLYGPFQP